MDLNITWFDKKYFFFLLMILFYFLIKNCYLRLDFPQWFNYASQGITVGHELSHGFDGVGKF